jgi:outer membrane immunogenic protein
MRKLVYVLTTATALISAPAMAADLGAMPVRAPVAAPVPYFSWSGIYIGVQGGFGWADIERKLVTSGTKFTDNLSGGLVGGTVGFNWQGGPWVWGVEADYAWADIGRTVDCFAAVAPGLRCGSTMDSFGTLRGRLGGAWDRVMIYATGGAAFADQSIFVNNTITGASVRRDRFGFGWTLGGGVEWAFFPNWSLKAEALYFDINSDRLSTAGFGLAAETVGIDTRFTGALVRGGINYRFDWGGPPGPVVARY